MDISPRCLTSSPLAQSIHLSLDLASCDEEGKPREWLLAFTDQSQAQPEKVDAAVVESCSGNSRVTVRAAVRPGAPGVFSLIVYTPAAGSSLEANPHEVHAVVPVLVAPNPAVQQEMIAVFDAMMAVVLQQLQQAGHDPTEDTGSKLTWVLHYAQLLWDVQAVLDCAASKPGCLPAEVAAGVLTAVLEFLGLHGCWCSISWLLAEAIRARLLQHAKAAAAQRLQETQPFAGLGGAEATGAMCAGFIMDLAASPVSSTNSCSPLPAHSSSRCVLQQLGTSGCCGSCSTYHSIRSSPGDASSSSSSKSIACSLEEAAVLLLPQPQQPAEHADHQQQQVVPDRSVCPAANTNYQWQAWNLLLAVTAVALVLVLLMLNSRQLAPCQSAAGGVDEQLPGCALPAEQHAQPVVVGPFEGNAGVLVNLLQHVPFLALLLVAVGMASRLCLVL